MKDKVASSAGAADVGCGVFYDSEPLKSWRPAHGELVGVAVSAPARSNVVLVAWPQGKPRPGRFLSFG
jgi:hypothetical protein